jgi:TolB-like protein/class 3 adenylate cyclase/Tfp pilus assembly protein PilF
MADDPFTENDFLQKITEVIEENLPDEQFGVSELAREMGMSRSSLLRKVKKETQLSVSQFIRDLRLKRAMEMLKDTSETVSEISYQVGFKSSSYFTKCFREHYGYPPGEAEKRDFDQSKAPSTTQSHRLVAIMFTDIQGYTALMQQDEGKALQFRNRHRKIFDSITPKHRGKILQYYGDGTLSIFQSAIDAVKCGIEIQLALRMAPQIPVRIGIHSGDLIIDKEDVIGDGVNVASRVESLAVAGSVFISGKIYDEVKNQTGIQTASMGHFEFKNVSKPMEIFAVTNPGLVVPQKDQLTGKLKRPSPDKRAAYGFGAKKFADIWMPLIALAIVAAGFFWLQNQLSQQNVPPTTLVERQVFEKSIAVLPFINDSNDSSNVYIINGLMESILNHLQKIEDLRVISRTSVERYRNTPKRIPEIAQELGVYYFVEGSGQKIGNQIQLNIQLIEAASDRHLWSEQYNREASDVFSLQREVAQKIATEISAIITPEEQERLEEIPTDNLEAWDNYLKGRELFYQENLEGLQKAIGFYEKAIQLDPEFAQAYAGLAVTYYFLELGQAEKQFSEKINQYADKALLYDPQSPQSLIAKAIYYLQKEEFASALPHLEKAHEYNPNSPLVINILSDFYARVMPDSEKYLEFALKGVQLDIASHDSATTSYIYLHLSNAFIQSGFVEEAITYINKSLDYNPNNFFSAYVKVFIEYAKFKNLNQAQKDLKAILEVDSNQLDVLQEVAKIAYFMENYEEAFRYYKRFIDLKNAMNLDVYPAENAKIAMVLRKMGRENEAEKYIAAFSSYANNDPSIYREINLCMLAAFHGDTQKALKHLKQFSQKENYSYWIPLFFEMDPLTDELQKLPAFKKIMQDIEMKFWERHEEIRRRLEEQNLI